MHAWLAVLLCTMSNAYRFVFECPNGHNINLQRKCTKEALSETEALEIFGDIEVSCEKLKCGWRGKASKAKASANITVQLDSFAYLLRARDCARDRAIVPQRITPR